MIVYLYRWKFWTGMVNSFEKAWSFVTKELREREGSLGSPLHLGSDGWFYGYAQWPSREARENARFCGNGPCTYHNEECYRRGARRDYFGSSG